MESNASEDYFPTSWQLTQSVLAFSRLFPQRREAGIVLILYIVSGYGPSIHPVDQQVCKQAGLLELRKQWEDTFWPNE